MLLPVGPVTRKGEFPGDPPGLPVKGICRECPRRPCEAC